MLFSTLSLLTGLVSYTSALPTTTPLLTNFYLVTTTQSTSTTNSSLLANVSATTVFDPFDQTTYLLREIGPGYNSLPTFNLTDGALHTLTQGIEGQGTYDYNSTEVENGGELQFLPSPQTQKGSLGLRGGFLLTAGGKAKGWTICLGQLGESTISWRGTNSTCHPTYIQAVAAPPY